MARQPVMDRLPHEKSDIWKKELKALMSDFCIPVNIIEQIIRTAERKAKPEECISARLDYVQGISSSKTVVNLTYPSESTKTTVFHNISTEF